MQTTTDSGLILPPGISLPPHIQPMETPAEEDDNETKAGALPTPTGWKLLCVVPEVDTKIAGTSLDLVRDTATMRQEEHATTVLFVLRVGPDAYKDTAKFPNGAWCKQGDWIVFGRYAGARIGVDGGEIRIINDDEVLARIDNPEDILHM